MENQNEVETDLTVEDAMEEIVKEGTGQADQVQLIATIAVALLAQDNSTSIVGPNSIELSRPYTDAAMGLLKAAHGSLVNEQQKAFDQIQDMVNKTNADRAAQREEALAESDAMKAMHDEDLASSMESEESPEPPQQSAVARAMAAAKNKLSRRADDQEADDELI